MSDPEADGASAPSPPSPATPGPEGDESARSSGEPARVVRRRDPADMTAEERAFVARYRADMPPHHDSNWG